MYLLHLCTLCYSWLSLAQGDHNPNPDPGLVSNPQFIFSTVNGSDVYMNSCLYGNGTSFVESLFEDFGE